MTIWTRWTRYLLVVVATVSAFVLLSPDAQAARMGGGRSIGKPSSGLFNRSAPRAPEKAGAAGAGAGQTAAAAGASRGGMMGPIAGLAAGLGLAALASYMGFGEELANIMMIVLLLFGGLFVVRFIMNRMNAGRSGTQTRGALAPAGNVGGGYTPNLARDMVNEPRAGAMAGSLGAAAAPAADLDTGLPAGFDADGFLRQAKVQFVRLQAVYDAGNLKDLAEFTTPEVYAELKLEINERGSGLNQTDVVTLNADLLGVDDTGPEYLASVQFHGMIREDPASPAKPFDETWTLTKPRNGSGGWVLAGIEQNDARA